MRIENRYFVLIAVLLCAAAFAFGPVPVDPETLGLGLIGIGAVAAAGEVLPARIREDLPAFENVVASGRASTEIPRYALTLMSVYLKLGGTTFNETHITEVRLRLGSKTIWFATGADLRKKNAYNSYYTTNRQFLQLDFGALKSKDQGGAFVGGIDMASLPAGKLNLEVLTSGATAPTLSAKATWGLPQDNDILQKCLQFTWGSASAGRRNVPLDFNRARIRRLYFLYSGTDFAATATASAFSGNTGNGAMGAVTVASACKVGVHKFVCIEPGANVGTFEHVDPDGQLVSSRMIVASAYSGGGLAFTLADGATDFIVGDGFEISVSENVNGNLSRVEVKKNGRSVWDYECAEARQLQKDNGFKPQSQMYVVDFEVDGWPDGSLPTHDAVSLEVFATLTAADNTITIYADVLDRPANN